MRLLALVGSAFLLAGCGAAISEEQPAADADTARIVVAWEGDAREGAFDLRDGTGVMDGTILTVDAVYEPLPAQLTASRANRWLKHPRKDWDPFFLAPLIDGPQQLLAFLESAERSDAVTDGEERGEPVTYYTATVRMEEFIAAQSPDRRAELEEVYADWEGMTFQLAVDSDGRFRRADFAFAEQEELVIEIYDYGVEVDARAPDPKTVLTWEEYEKLLQAECERAKKEGRENEVPHCASCGAGEGEA